MGKFLKNFGLGLVYIVLLPILLALVVIFGIFGLGVFCYEFLASTIRFFQGKEPFPALDEDLKVAQIKKAQMDAQMGGMPAPQAAAPNGPSTVYVQQNYYQGQKTGEAAPTTPSPTPLPQNQPIEGAGYFKNPTPPTLDATSKPAPALSNEVTPTAIPHTPLPDPTAYIDISHDDDPKGGKE